MFVNKHFANFTVNNSRILWIMYVKFLGYYFYMSRNIKGDFKSALVYL